MAERPLFSVTYWEAPEWSKMAKAEWHQMGEGSEIRRLGLSPGSVPYYDIGSVCLPQFSRRCDGANNSTYFLGWSQDEIS